MKRIIIAVVVIAVLGASMTIVALASTNNDIFETTEPTTSEVATSPDGSDSLSILTENINFQNHGFVVEPLTEAVKVDKPAAIEIANESIRGQSSTKAESVTTVLAKFTDTESPVLPESNIALKDYPVWIVTYHGVTLQKQGKPGGKVYADKNIVIDANSGEVLETFSYIIK